MFVVRNNSTHIEQPYAGDKGPQFHNYFKTYQAIVVCQHMHKDLREAIGLGSPPLPYTTNASEAVNSKLKQHVQYKETEWPVFVDEMKQLLSAQRNDMIRALSGRGQYRVCDSYHFLTVSLEEWNKMQPDQRKCVIKAFDDFTPTFSAVTSVVNDSHLCVGSSSNPTQYLSVTAEDSNIISIPLVTLHGMWSKANSLLQLGNAITDAPGADATAKMVLSYRSVVPHLVRKKGKAQYVCDDNCPQWLSSKICSLLQKQERNYLPF